MSVCARFALPPEGSRATRFLVEWELLMQPMVRRIALAAVQAALAAAEVPGRTLLLQPDRRGIVYGDEAEVAL